jgi:N-acetylneuraminic acid mutarotase
VPCLCDAPANDGATTPWMPRAEMPAAIQETAVVAIGGEVYVLGGFEGGSIADKLQVYDVETDAWSEGPALPARAHHINATVAGGAIVVAGDLQGVSFTPVGDVWTWTPGAAEWTVAAAMPRPRGASVIAAIDGVVYVAGGIGDGGVTAAVDAYDVAGGEWTERAPMPAPRDHACGGVIDGVLYVAGGREAEPSQPLADVFAYDPEANEWTAVADMPTGRGGTACGVVYGRLVVVGGEGNADDPSGVFAETESYDPATDTWTTLEPMPHPRHGMGAAVVDGGLYVPGGADVTLFGAVATHDVFWP